MVHVGEGRHLLYLNVSQVQRFTKYIEIAIPINAISTTFARISICLFVLRVLVLDRRWRRAIYGFIAFISVVNLAYFIETWLDCIPFSYSWNPFQAGRCLGHNVNHNMSYLILSKLSSRCRRFNLINCQQQ